MGKKALSSTTVIVNDVAYPIVPNTLVYTEGFGEYNMRAASVGSGKGEIIFSENAENKMSKIMFEMFPTAENIKTIREWKVNQNQNLIEISDPDIQKTFNNAALTSDYEVKIGADTTIPVEFMSDPVI